MSVSETLCVDKPNTNNATLIDYLKDQNSSVQSFPTEWQYQKS